MVIITDGKVYNSQTIMLSLAYHSHIPFQGTATADWRRIFASYLITRANQKMHNTLECDIASNHHQQLSWLDHLSDVSSTDEVANIIAYSLLWILI